MKRSTTDSSIQYNQTMIPLQRLMCALLLIAGGRRHVAINAFAPPATSSASTHCRSRSTIYHFHSHAPFTARTFVPSQKNASFFAKNPKSIVGSSMLLLTTSTGDNVDGLDASITPEQTTTETTGTTVPKQATFVQRIRQAITSKYQKSDDGLTFRQRLAKMGLAAILSYGFVSNMSYAVTVSIAWYIHNVQTKCSPLLKGQWKQFLLVYSGFWVFNNIVRPLRLAISVGIVAPQFDRLLLFIQKKLNVSRTTSIAITVFMANVVCTIAVMSFGIIVASILSGVPIFP